MRELLKSVRTGTVAGIASMLFLCALMAVLQQFIDINERLLGVVSVMIVSVSSYVSAYTSTQLCRTKGLIQGILCATTLYILLFAITLFRGEISVETFSPSKLIFCLIFGVVGGVKGINTKKTDRY